MHCHLFPLHSLAYLHTRIRPRITTVTPRGRAPTSEQILFVALCFIPKKGRFFNTMGDAEHTSEASACRAIRDIIFHLYR